MSKKSCIFGSIKKFLRFVSLGKYHQGLYYRGKTFYSSIYGGMFSIIIAIALLIYSIFVLIPVFNGSIAEISTAVKDITQTNYQNINLQEFNSNFLYYQVLVKNKVEEIYDYTTSCSNISLVMRTPTTDIGPFKFQYDGSYSNSFHSCVFNQQTNQEYALQSKQLKDNITIDQDALVYSVQFNIFNSYNLSNMKIANVLITHQSKVISKDGIQNITNLITLDKSTNLLRLTLQNLNQTANKIGLFTKYEESFYILSIERPLSYDADDLGSFVIDIDINDIVNFVELSHYNAITGLSKIGGILAIVKVITAFISFLHQKRFERKLNKDLQSSGSLPLLNNRQSNNLINEAEKFEISTFQNDLNSYDGTSLIGPIQERKSEIFHEVYSYSNFKALLRNQKEQNERNNEMMQMLVSQEKTINSLKQEVEMLKEESAHQKYE